MAANISSALPGDVVKADVRGRKFFAEVAARPVKEEGNGLVVEVKPISPNVNYFRVRGRDVEALYRKLGRSRREQEVGR